MNAQTFDVIVIGAGPGGSTAALVLARAGLRVAVLDKDRQPRFHIGESILPRLEVLLRELGLSEKVRQLPHLPKYGAEFGFGDSETTLKFQFKDGLLPGFPIFNIERAHLDKMLLEEARGEGATVVEDTLVRSIVKLAENDVEVATDRGNFKARMLLDASGHGTVVARHLGNRRNMTDPQLQKVAHFGHYNNVEHLPGENAGHPGIFMCDEGWFWVIGLAPGKTSVGFVTRPSFVKTLDGVKPDRLLRWAIDRCPIVRERMKEATPVEGSLAGEEKNHILADFSYTCSPHAGPGYFLVGDAGCFLDPIFSTGVTLAMVGGAEAAKHTAAVLQRGANVAKARKDYIYFVTGATGTLWRLIKNYYRHEFRELFMNGTGPQQVHRAVISILAGQVFPKPVWALRWRLELFFLCMKFQTKLPMVPKKPRFSLMKQTPVGPAKLHHESKTVLPEPALV